MSYNGSGTFNINSAGQPVVSGTVISSTAFNALTADLGTGLTTALTKDGQSTPTANITLGGYKITNLAAGTLASDAVRFDQLTSAGVPLITVAGTADAITGTITPSLTAYTTGGLFSFVVGSSNTTAVTLNIDGLGAKAVTRTGSVALVAGDMVTGQVVLVEYDGTRFQLLNGNSFTNLRASGTLGVTGATTLSSTLGVTGLTTLGVTGVAFPGSSSGTATIVAPAVAGTPTITLPTTTGTIVLGTAYTNATPTMTTARLLGRTTAGTGAAEEITVGTGLTLSAGSLVATATGLTLGTPVASTSGTSIDFTGIPSGTKEITITFVGVSTTGSSDPIIQIGPSGGVETSGYVGTVTFLAATTTASSLISAAGFSLCNGNFTSASVSHGSIVLTLENSSTNTWVCNAGLGLSNLSRATRTAGSKSLAGAINKLRITTAGGSDTFSAGEINILYM